MPRLIVFDLDLTLWHCGPRLWCDQLTPPIRLAESGRVVSACDTEVCLFPEVLEILDELSHGGHRLGIASRTSAPVVARKLLDLFGIARHFSHQQIYPGDKSAHFLALHQETGIGFNEMIFFDDEERNIRSVSQLGVAAHLAPQGMTRELLNFALESVSQ